MKKQTKRFIIIVGMLCLVSGTVLGATVGTKITAQLLQMKIVKDNQQVLKDTKTISYNNSTYVPLRAFGDVTGVKIDYKDGVIYLGDNNTIINAPSETINPYWTILPSLDKNASVTKITESKYFNDRQQYVDKAHKVIGATLKDPMSAIFDFERDGIPEMWVTKDGTLVVCVDYRAKNSYGGYETGSNVVMFKNGDLNNYKLY